MTGRVVFACLVGLVGAGLMGCARTSPEISSFELGRQLQKVSSDLNNLSTAVTQLKQDSGSIRAELPKLWEEILATDELLIKLTERLTPVDARGTAKGSAPPPPQCGRGPRAGRATGGAADAR